MLCPCQEAVAGGGVRPEAAEGEIATDGQKNADLDKTKDCLLFYNKLQLFNTKFWLQNDNCQDSERVLPAECRMGNPGQEDRSGGQYGQFSHKAV